MCQKHVQNKECHSMGQVVPVSDGGGDGGAVDHWPKYLTIPNIPDPRFRPESVLLKVTY